MINLAIVGLGRFGRRHADAANASGRFRVLRAVVRDVTTAEEFAAARTIALSTNLAEVLADPRVDAVSLATPHSLHVSEILQAAAAGKHVLAEKPLALTRTDAELAVAACAEARVVIAVGHDNRFYPAILEIKRLVESGALGTILHAEANLSHDSSRKLPRASAAVSERVSLEAGTRPRTGSWRFDRSEAPAGSIAHLGVHRIDTFVQLFGKVRRVYAASSLDSLNAPWADTVAVMLEFGSGMTGYAGSSLATPLNSRLQVFGEDGWVEARGPHDLQEYLRTSLRSVSLYRKEGSLQTAEFDAVDSVRLNFEAFADAIEGKSAYPVPADEMIHVVAVLEAIGQSLQTGQPVSVS